METIGLVIVIILSVRCILDTLNNTQEVNKNENSGDNSSHHYYSGGAWSVNHDCNHDWVETLVIDTDESSDGGGSNNSLLDDADDEIAQMVDNRPYVDTSLPVMKDSKR